jgi:prevent-host-death family protein
MQTMTITDFKAHALRKIGQVAASKEPITITRRGLPVVEIIPWKPQTRENSFGMLAGSLLHEGDIVSPAAETHAFEACR